MGKKLNTKKNNIILFRNVRSIVNICAAILVIPFAWLKLGVGGPIFHQITNEITAEFLFRFSLIVYFMCWVFGPIIDANIQEEYYTKPLDPKKVITGTVVFAIILTFLFGLLCYWVNSFKIFFWVLEFFLLIDVIGWLFIHFKVIPNTINESYIEYLNNKDYGSLFSLEIVKEHISGKWRAYRFIFAFSFVLFIGILAYTDLSVYINQILKVKSPDIIKALSFLIYIILMEGYIFYRRIKTVSSISAIEELMNKYSIEIK